MKKLLLFAALLFAPALFAQQYPQTPNVGLAANRPVNCNAINPVQPNQPDWYFSTDTQALSICKAQNTWSNVNGGGGGGGCTVPGTSGALLYDTVTGCSDTTGIAYSFPGSVPTLTWTNGSATAVISPTSVVVSDGSGNSAGLFNSGVGSFSQVGGVSTTNIDGATVTQTDSSTGHSIDWDGSTASGQFTETAAPGGNPPSGSDFVYFNSTTHLFTCLTHTGGNCLPSGVTGPGSAVSGDIATFNGTSGAIIQDSGTTITSAGQPQFASYTISAASGTYSARNNTTGVVDATGTDAGALIQTAINNMSSTGTCGTVYLKTPPSSAVYNINTLSTESTGGFTNTYAIGIPGAVSSGQYCQWTIEGEGAPATVNQFDSTGVQATGTTLYITPTAVTSAGASTVEIAGIWARPDTVNGAGAWVILRNIEVRFPTNQRGCETGIDLTQALGTYRDNVATDFNIAPGSLALPVPGSGCTGGIGGGLIGQTTTASSKEENNIANSYSTGFDVNWDIQSEHTIMDNVFGLNGNHCIDYGVRGGALTAPSSWRDVECVWQVRGLTLGANLVSGSLLDISSLVFEDENGGTFANTYHAIETNPGFTWGHISAFASKSSVGNLNLPNIFDGGGGQMFQQQAANPQRPTFSADTGTRANASTLGFFWATNAAAGNQNLTIHSNAFTPPLTSTFDGWESFSGVNYNPDQFSKITVSAIDAAGGGGPTVRASTTAKTFYEYLCGEGSARRLIVRYVAAATTILTTETGVSCVATDTLEIDAFGTNPTYIVTYRNGVQDLTATDSSPITSGAPGMEVYSPTTLGGDAATHWSGGNLATNNGVNSIYQAAAFAPSYNTLTKCANGASPAVCAAAAAGTVAIPTGATPSLVVNTTAVTAASQILLNVDESATISGTTCNTSLSTLTNPVVTARTAGTSFTIQINSTLVSNPACVDYLIIN